MEWQSLLEKETGERERERAASVPCVRQSVFNNDSELASSSQRAMHGRSGCWTQPSHAGTSSNTNRPAGGGGGVHQLADF